jgi:hypothetical protein
LGLDDVFEGVAQRLLALYEDPFGSVLDLPVVFFSAPIESSPPGFEGVHQQSRGTPDMYPKHTISRFESRRAINSESCRLYTVGRDERRQEWSPG